MTGWWRGGDGSNTLDAVSRIDCSLAPWHTPVILAAVKGETGGLEVGSQFGSGSSTATNVWHLELISQVHENEKPVLLPLVKVPHPPSGRVK